MKTTEPRHDAETWFDRTLEYRASRLGKKLEPGESASREVVTLAPLPCWAHLSAAERRTRIAAMLDRIVLVGRAERRGRAVLGRERILRQHPHQQPSASDHWPAPLVHAATKAMRIAMKAAYRAFLAAYRFAADQLRAGNRARSSRVAASRRRYRRCGASRRRPAEATRPTRPKTEGREAA